MRGLEFVGDVGGKTRRMRSASRTPSFSWRICCCSLGLAVGALLGLGPGAAGQPGPPQRQAHGQGEQGFHGARHGMVPPVGVSFAGGARMAAPCRLPVYQP